MTDGIPGPKSSPARKNAAIARCCKAWEQAYEAKFEESESEFYAKYDAHNAYRQAMPPLSGYDDICNFIACVTHGMLIGAIENEKASKLLYAAQVALSSVRNQPKKQQSRA